MPFRIPRSWFWKDLKLALIIGVCFLPSLTCLVFNFYLSSLLVVAWSIFIVQNAYFKPVKLSFLYTRFFFEYLLEKPDLLSQLRPLGLDLFNSQLRDYSIEFGTYEKEKIKRDLAYLNSFENQSMSSIERQSFDVMKYFLNVNLRCDLSDEFFFHKYLINQMMGAQSEVISFLTKFHRIRNLDEADAYLIRVKIPKVQRIARVFDQLIEQQNERQKRKIETPRFTLKRVIDELEAFRNQLKTTPEQNPLFLTLSSKFDDIKCPTLKRIELVGRLLTIFQRDVLPAYDRLLFVLQKEFDNATTDHGVWKLPKGDEYYRRCLEFHTTTKMSPEQIHELGKTHVQRIQNEMRKILKEKQIDTWQDFRTSLIDLEKHREQKYPNIDESRQKILDDYREIIEQIDMEMHRYFSSTCQPATKCVVERVPSFKEATSPAAYYFPAALDGKTPGTFFANLRNIDEIVKFKMNSLAYHEAVPGHHFQLSVAQSLKHLPFFRRMVPFTAYIEGWALYTEQLAAEQGFHQSWFSYLGYLDYQLLRSCRLVVDTGIHWKRWTREYAIDYMTENTCMKREEVVTEIERYFVFPGQACAYMVGCQMILALREKAQLALKDRFDLKDFHDVILLNGALPLNILEDLIDRYIEEKCRLTTERCQ